MADLQTADAPSVDGGSKENAGENAGGENEQASGVDDTRGTVRFGEIKEDPVDDDIDADLEEIDVQELKHKTKLGVIGMRNGFLIMRVKASDVHVQNPFTLKKKTFEKIHEEEQKVIGKKSMRKLEMEGKEDLRRVSGRYKSTRKGRKVGTTHPILVLDTEEGKESDYNQAPQLKQYKHGKKQKQKQKPRKKKKKGKVDPVEEANQQLLDHITDSALSYNSLNCVRFLGYGRFGAIQLAQEIYEEIPEEVESESALMVVKKFEVNENKDDYAEMKHMFLRELVVLQKLQDQPYFLKLIAVGKPAEDAPLCATFEYMSSGCLKEFLCTGFIGIGEKPVLIKDRYTQPRVHPKATPMQLMRIANDVALGMAYLADNKIIHRDLNATNVLLDDNLVGKIAGFEFAMDETRDPPVKDYKIEKRSTIRWLSVETLVDGMYSTMSDVWSFGMLLWEIITLGGKPYPGVKGSLITKYLELGYRLHRPGNCSMKVYDIMLKCWDAQPESRPSFNEIVELMDEVMVQTST